MFILIVIYWGTNTAVLLLLNILLQPNWTSLVWPFGGTTYSNSLFLSSPKPLHQREAWCTTIHTKMSLICKRMKSHFHMKGWAPRLALMNRFKEIRKWPITLCHFRFRETIAFVWLLRIQWHGNCDSSCTVDHPSGDHSKENRVSTTARFYALVKRGSVTVFGLHVLIWIVENLKIVAY